MSDLSLIKQAVSALENGYTMNIPNVGNVNSLTALEYLLERAILNQDTDVKELISSVPEDFLKFIATQLISTAAISGNLNAYKSLQNYDSGFSSFDHDSIKNMTTSNDRLFGPLFARILEKRDLTYVPSGYYLSTLGAAKASGNSEMYNYVKSEYKRKNLPLVDLVNTTTSKNTGNFVVGYQAKNGDIVLSPQQALQISQNQRSSGGFGSETGLHHDVLGEGLLRLGPTSLGLESLVQSRLLSPQRGTTSLGLESLVEPSFTGGLANVETPERKSGLENMTQQSARTGLGLEKLVQQSAIKPSSLNLSPLGLPTLRPENFAGSSSGLGLENITTTSQLGAISSKPISLSPRSSSSLSPSRPLSLGLSSISRLS